jgi:hypothetical protein
MIDTPRTDALVGNFDFPWSFDTETLVRHAETLERELTKAINCARFMAAYLEGRGETSGRAYALCREIGWPQS